MKTKLSLRVSNRERLKLDDLKFMVTSPKYLFETLCIGNLYWKALSSSRFVSKSYSKTTVGFQSLNYQ